MILGPGKRAMQFLGEDEKRGAGSSGCNSWKCRRGLNHRGYEKEAGWGKMFGLSWKIQFLLGRHPTMTHPFIHHHLSPDISIHYHPSLCRKGWVKMGWTNEFQLMSSEENNHGTISDKCGYITSANADDWSWKINKLFWEKSSDVPNEALISLVCKCGLLGLTNAQQPNQQIHISSVRKYMQILEGLYCYMHMLERSVIKITTLTKKDDWS